MSAAWRLEAPARLQNAPALHGSGQRGILADPLAKMGVLDDSGGPPAELPISGKQGLPLVSAAPWARRPSMSVCETGRGCATSREPHVVSDVRLRHSIEQGGAFRFRASRSNRPPARSQCPRSASSGRRQFQTGHGSTLELFRKARLLWRVGDCMLGEGSHGPRGRCAWLSGYTIGHGHRAHGVRKGTPQRATHRRTPCSSVVARAVSNRPVIKVPRQINNPERTARCTRRQAARLQRSR